MLVTAVIPGYNHAPYLRERIESVLLQDYEELEVVLLDDCSTDGSADLMREYACGKRDRHGRQVRFVANESNSGNTFLQWDKGVALARGEYVWIAESDDVAEPNFLSECMARLKATPEAVLAFTWSDIVGSDTSPLNLRWDEPWRYRPPGVYEGQDFCLRRMVYKNLLYNASMVVFRKDCYERVSPRFMQYRHCGDWLFWFELCRQGRVCEVPLRLNKFRQHIHKVSNAARSSGTDFAEMAEIQTLISEALRLSPYRMRCLRGRQTKRIRRALRRSDDAAYGDYLRALQGRFPAIYGGSLLDVALYTVDKLFNFSHMKR